MSGSDHPATSDNVRPTARPDSPLNLRWVTPARVALDRVGSSISTRDALEFSLAHAQARDAVHSTLGVASLMASLRERNLSVAPVRSAVSTRTEYLLRPDLGRTLSDASRGLLAHADHLHAATSATRLCVVLADGLSALATERHALSLLDALLPLLDESWALTPVVVAEQARVALGDEIGPALHADVIVMLIGERPGLSAPDSLGAYITWSPRQGRTDAERNCVSNIRTEGLDCDSAAGRIAWYLNEGRRLGLTGVALRASDPKAMPPP
jgi:ethanolamine ammonia-lyase small subunit